jgi:hypothetical protein
VREEEPDAIGVFLFGSRVRGEAAPTSDVDLQAVTLAAPRIRYRTWFVGETHVSVAATAAETLRRSQETPRAWAHGFAAESPGEWLWSTAAAVVAVGDPPTLRYPPAEPELEDFVEYAAKGFRARDSIRLRLAAQGLGRTAVPLLLDLNPQETVRTGAEAVAAARALRLVPERWSDDLPALLGLVEAPDADLAAAVERVAFGVLALLRERGSRAGAAQPDCGRYLHDGTFERHLRAATADRRHCYPEIP